MPDYVSGGVDPESGCENRVFKIDNGEESVCRRQKILVRLFHFERLPEIAAQKDQPWPTYEKAKTDFKSVNEYIASKAKDVWVILNNARIPDSPCWNLQRARSNSCWGSPSDYRSVSGKIIATRTNRTNEESGFPIGLYCCLAVPRISGYAFAGNRTRMGINFVIYAMTH